MSEKINTLIEKIKNAKSIAISGHKNPDGDAICSALALMKIIELNFGKTATVIYDGNIPKDRIRNYQETVLSKQRLAEISKANKVPSATEVYARKERLQDSYSITLTYGINGEPFPPMRNNFVVIISKELNSDIDSLFGNNELIIIKK